MDETESGAVSGVKDVLARWLLAGIVAASLLAVGLLLFLLR